MVPKMSPKDLPDLSHLSVPGAVIAVKVRPGGRRNQVVMTEEGLKIETTTAPEDGKANRDVAKLLAKAMGVAPSRLELVRGATSRQKEFRLSE